MFVAYFKCSFAFKMEIECPDYEVNKELPICYLILCDNMLNCTLIFACVSGEIIADENEEGEEKSENSSTKYQLTGVVVHSGQASGGHYFSYILHR